MVKEFTDLQGVVGGLYARARGRYPDSVWKAIYDQYRPASGADEPAARRPPARSCRSPTASTRSPASSASASCRPASQGPLRPAPRRPRHRGDRDRPQLARGLAPDRAQGHRAVSGRRGTAPSPSGSSRSSVVSSPTGSGACSSGAARATTRSRPCSTGGVWDFADAADRARALSDARRHMDFESLILAAKRIRNIVGDAAPGAPSPELYREPAERALASDFLQAKQAIDALLGGPALPGGHGDDRVARALARPLLRRRPRQRAGGRDLRRNRLALLGPIQQEFSRLADFSEIVVEK